MRTAKLIAGVILVASSLLACGSQGQADGQPAARTQAQKQGEVLAKVGSQVITTEDFQAKMNEQSPFIRQRYNTLERKQEFLENLIRFELLAQEAERRGLRDDPDVQEAMKKTMVQKLMRAAFEDEAEGAVDEAALRAFYDANLDDYMKPERVRVSHLFLAAAKGDASRAKAKAEATRLLADVRAKEAGPMKLAFAEAARTRSEDGATKLAGGDLLFKTQAELAAAWGDELAKAAFGLTDIGQLGGLVETDKGIHLIKLTGRQSAVDRPFEQVKAQIQNRLFREKRTKEFEGFVDGLRAKAGVEIDTVALGGLDLGIAAADEAPQPIKAIPVSPTENKGPSRIKLTGPTGRTIEMPAKGPKFEKRSIETLKNKKEE